MHVICSLDSTAYFDERVSDAFKASLLRYAPDPSTVCMNLATGAASRYTNWYFNSFAQINDQYYAVDSQGMWLLEGSNDNGSPIISGIDLGRIDFHSNNLKHVPNVYVSGKSSSNTIVTVTTSSGLTYDYFARSFDVAAKVQRHDLGRGLRETWYGLVVRNSAGSNLEVSGVSVPIVDSPRKI